MLIAKSLNFKVRTPLRLQSYGYLIRVRVRVRAQIPAHTRITELDRCELDRCDLIPGLPSVHSTRWVSLWH
jgi:hypothetical protein